TARSGGAFIGCSNYPECRYTRPLAGEAEEGDIAGPDGKLLGENPDGIPVSLRSGRFGPYVQLGVATEEEPKPKRSSIPKGMDLGEVDLQKALDLLSLPRLIGEHPEGGPVEASIGRFGPYVMHTTQVDGKAKKLYANIKDPAEVLIIGMNRAVELLAEKAARGGRGAAAKPIRELGEHPEHGGAINVMAGRYGPYVKWEKINATLPRDMEPEGVTMEIAVELVDAKAATKGKKKPAKKKVAAKKPAAKKKPVAKKKPAAKKAE
ncbi:MAG: DNA topoisomerase I, partial [Alphaproteobacteria bacterium]|nr:DNA topoisomerase I [Alphaproteobacteria bacterium]